MSTGLHIRYMIESLSNRVHLKTGLAAKYTNFYRGLVESPTFPVKYQSNFHSFQSELLLCCGFPYWFDGLDEEQSVH